MSTWRRQAQVFGPLVRDLFGVEVAYARAVQAAGAVPFLLPQPLPTTTAAECVAGFDGLVLIGGEDVSAEVSGAAPDTIGINADADRDRWEIALLRAALDAAVPVLAVCRGMQLLNVAFGGTLHGHMTGRSPQHPDLPEDLSSAFDFRHRVDLIEHSRIRAAVGVASLETNSLHHQSVDRLGDGLNVTGVSGDGVIEAIERRTPTWCVGVQWHPELMLDDPYQQALLTTFVDNCRPRRTPGESELTSRTPSLTSGRAT
jgi:putative glutamine amidotransferase